MATPSELAAMRHAIALSAFGLGTTSPNPPVGCVILDANGRIVGQGFHRRKGEPHAEANALADAGERANGGTAVVTLEPCNHHGRTPPCHQALIDAGIRRILVALIDPTSRGEGGIARLRQGRLDVEVGVLAYEARLVLGPWLRALGTKRPYVHWLHVMDDDQDADVLATVPDAATLKASHDVVLLADGRVAEAVRGAHGDNLSLPKQVDLTTPKAALETLYVGGVRLVLLIADQRVHLLLRDGLIDQATVLLPKRRSNEARRVHAYMSLLGDELQLIDVTRLAGWAQLTLRSES